MDPSALEELREVFAQQSNETLRHDLRETGLALHALVEGVRLDSLDALGRTLLSLAELYEAGNGRQEQAVASREAALAARRKAEFVLRNPKVSPEARQAMEEKLLWLRVWLENPPLFPRWLSLRAAEQRRDT